MEHSTEEQAIDQRSADLDKNAWMDNYPVGTVIESSVYTAYRHVPPEQYQVISREECQHAGSLHLSDFHLPVRLIGKPGASHRFDGYDGFAECHIDAVISKPIAEFEFNDVLGQEIDAMLDSMKRDFSAESPWIPSPEELEQPLDMHPLMDAYLEGYRAAWDNSLKPQPKFGWWGDATTA